MTLINSCMHRNVYLVVTSTVCFIWLYVELTRDLTPDLPYLYCWVQIVHHLDIQRGRRPTNIHCNQPCMSHTVVHVCGSQCRGKGESACRQWIGTLNWTTCWSALSMLELSSGVWDLGSMHGPEFTCTGVIPWYSCTSCPAAAVTQVNWSSQAEISIL